MKKIPAIRRADRFAAKKSMAVLLSLYALAPLPGGQVRGSNNLP